MNPTWLADSPSGAARGVLAAEREGPAVARVEARKGQATRVAQLLRAELGIEPPEGPRRASRGDAALAGIAPQTWLATREGADGTFPQTLRSLLGDCASVVDQSDAFAVIRLTGPRVREMLAKLVPIDVHPRSFRVNDVAQTLCGHVRVVLWRLEDGTSSVPTDDGARTDAVFELWAGRSLADSLWRAVCHGGAEFGVGREAAGDQADTGRRST